MTEPADLRLEAEGELAMAALAMDDSEWGHAATHIANAFSCDPTLPEAHEALSALAARTDDPLPLFDLGEHPYVGTVVARAHLLAAAGRVDDAVELLLTATRAVPDRSWAAVAWFEDPDLPGRLDANRLGYELLQLAVSLPDPVPDADRAPLGPVLQFARRVARARPDTVTVLLGASSLGRRLGAAEEAVAWAAHAEQVAPGQVLAPVMLGSAYRALGDVANAEAALRRAARLDPSNLSVHTDLAELLADAGRTDEALAWIEAALRVDPRHSCAFPTGCVLRYQRDGDVNHLVALADFLRDEPDDGHGHAGKLAAACHGRGWLNYVPKGREAVSNTLDQVLGQVEPGTTTLTCTIGQLEAPSAIATVLRCFPGSEVTIQAAGAIDLRLPRQPVRYRVWEYPPAPAGEPPRASARPALPPPSQAAVDGVLALAGRGWWAEPTSAYDEAVRLSGLGLGDLLGLMVYPPAPPDTDLGRTFARHEPGLWVRLVQCWAALGLTHFRADEPWPGSTRRQVLADLAAGVPDWASEAALFGLVVAAWTDPAARPDVAGLVRSRLADAIEVHRHVDLVQVYAFAELALLTPGLDAEAVAAARRVLSD
ncbi:MAG: tetratricopeptide repeat protein [Mycobacteriales bacterium]